MTVVKSLPAKTQLPGIDSVSRDSLERAVEAIKTQVEIRFGTGRIGNDLDRAVTRRELFEAGMVRVNLGGRFVGVPALPGGPFLPIPLPSDEPATPPAVTGVSASGGIMVVVVEWDWMTYGRLAYFEVWRATVDDLGQAAKVGQTQANLYADNVGQTGATFYYWVRAVSDVDLPGPYNGVSGTQASTGFIMSEHLTDLLITANKLADGSVDWDTKLSGEQKIRAEFVDTDFQEVWDKATIRYRNALSYSEDLTQAYYQKGGGFPPTYQAETFNAPGGIVLQKWNAAGDFGNFEPQPFFRYHSKNVLSWHVKADTAAWFQINLYDIAENVSRSLLCTIVAGVPTFSSAPGITSYAITDIGSGVYRVSAYIDGTALGIVGRRTRVFLDMSAGDLFVGGQQLEFDEATTVVAYVKTTATPSIKVGNWTNVEGNAYAELIQSNNLLTDPDELQNWTLGAVTVTPNTGTGLDGLPMDKIVETTANGNHAIQKLVAIPVGSLVNASINLKAAERTKCLLQLWNEAGAPLASGYADLTAGTINVDVGTGTIEKAHNGSYRIWIASTAVTASANVQVILYLQDDAGATSYVGDDTKGVFATAIQLDIGNTKKRYVRAGSVSGGKFLRIGANGAGMEQMWLVHDGPNIPFDPQKVYRLKVRARRLNGAGKMYVGWAGFADDGTTFVNALTGANVHGNAHYHVARDAAPSADWTEYVGYTKGYGASIGSGVVGTLGVPGQMHPRVRYIRPLILVNWQAAAGMFDIDSLIVSTYIEQITAANSSEYIGDSAIVTTHITNAAITTAKIGNAQITSALIGTAQIQTAHIIDAAIGSAAIANLAVGTAHIQDAAILNAKIGNLAVDSAKIADAAIVTAKIGELQVTGAKIADATITTAKIGSAQITSALIANAQILTAHIGDAQITTAKIGNAQITNAKIGNAQVDTLQLAGQAVTIPVSAFTNDLNVKATGTGEITLQSAAITSSGAPIQIGASFVWYGGTGSSGPTQGAVRIKRGSTIIYDSGLVTLSNGAGNAGSHQTHDAWSFAISDTPGAGSVTYSVTFNCTFHSTPNGESDVFFETRSLVLLETKR